MTTKRTKELKIRMGKYGNKLRRMLLEQNSVQGTSVIGVTLNKRALVRGYVNSFTGVPTPDLMVKSYADPEVNACFTFAIDSSSSMNWNYAANRESMHKEAHALCDALLLTLGNLGFETAAAGAGMNYDSDSPEGCSTRCTPVAYIYKERHERWTTKSAKERFPKDSNGGTCVVSWAEVAWQLAKESSATYKFAFFLTDGEDDNAKQYMESMRRQALADGVILIGIGFGVQGEGLPNGISSKDTDKIADAILEHICKVIKGGKEGVELRL